MPPVTCEARTPECDTEQLHTRLKQCLTFAVEHTPKLPLYAPHWIDDSGEDVVMMEDKVLAETAILVLLAARVQNMDDETVRLLAELTRMVEGPACSDRIKRTLLRWPHNAPALGIAQVALSRVGHGDRETLEIIRRIFSADLAETLERIPYRAMECSWVRYLLDGGDGVNVTDALPLSVALKQVHPVTMHRTTGYAVTHAVMFATDFGALPPPSALQSDSLAALVDACTAWTLVNEDLDLLIEFIITATLLRRPWSPYIRLGWACWTSVSDDLGFLPSPSFDAEKFRALQGLPAAAYAFRHVYHTNYVGGLLCAILLSMDRPSTDWCPPRIRTDKVQASCAAAIRRARTFVAADDNEPTSTVDPVATMDPEEALHKVAHLLRAMLPAHTRWEQVAASSNLPPVDRAAVLADAAIIHAARGYDLPKLLMSLDVAMSLPCSPSLTALEGVSFLVRQQLPDGCIGLQFLSPDARRLPAALETTAVVSECLGEYARVLADMR